MALNVITFNGQLISTRQFKKLLRDEYEEAFQTALKEKVDEIVEDLERLIRQIRDGGAQRGRGTAKERYNDPLANAKVIAIQEFDKSYTVYVDSRVFNILDQGSPARRSGSLSSLMKFPVYNGNTTIPNNVDRTGTAVVAANPKWVSTVRVAPVQPRNFIRTMVKKHVRSGKIRLRTKRGLFAGIVDLSDYIKISEEEV